MIWLYFPNKIAEYLISTKQTFIERNVQGWVRGAHCLEIGAECTETSDVFYLKLTVNFYESNITYQIMLDILCVPRKTLDMVPLSHYGVENVNYQKQS